MEIKNLSDQDEFSQLFKDKKVHVDNIVQQLGTPLFDKSQITEHSHILVRLLRVILVDNKVTVEDFSNKYRIYALEVLRMHPTKINTQKRNLLSAMKRDKITWRSFVEILVNVLGFNINDLHIKLTTINGEIKTYTLSEADHGG